MKSKLWVIPVWIVFLFLSYFVTEKLVDGARWSSGLALGGVDNWLYDDQTFYPQFNGSITPGTSYFPGVVFLSLLCRIIFGYDAETLIILIGGLFAIFLFWGFTVLVSEDNKKRTCLFFISILFFSLQFKNARFYILEVHPDLITLMFFVWGVICIDRYISNNKIKFYISAIILFFFSGLFKQNAAFLFLGLGSYIFFSKKFSFKEKFYIFISELIAGLGVIFIVFLIEGCWENCVTVNSLHNLMDLREYIYYIKKTIKNNFVFIICVFGYLVFLLKGKIKLETRRERMWLASAIGWNVFCLFAAAKYGANDGNVEAAIIAMMPFVLIFIENFVGKKIGEDFVVKIISKKHLIISFSVVLTFLILGMSVYNFEKFEDRMEAQKNFSTWLSNNYSNKNVAYCTSFYELLNGANINKKTDLYTAALWHNAGLLDDSKVYKISQVEKWDLIITHKAIGCNLWPKTFSGFHKMDPSLYPQLSEYYNNNLEVYVKEDKNKKINIRSL